MKHSAFGKQVVFECRRPSLGDRLESGIVTEQVKAFDTVIAQKYPLLVTEFAMLMRCSAIEFQLADDAHEALTRFRAFWGLRDSMPTATLWQPFLELDGEITDEWRKAFDMAFTSLTKPDHAPAHALTEAEKNDPNSKSEESPSAKK